MSTTTMTVRVDTRLRRALEARARRQGKTLSALVRDTLVGIVAEQPFGARVGPLRGSIAMPRIADDPVRARIRAHNWRR
jgi:hypothetical protein